MPDSKKRLLFVTTRLFWPADSGRKVVLWNYCKGLSEQLGYEVRLFSFLEGDQKATLVNEAPGFISAVKLAQPLSYSEKAFGLIKALCRRSLDPFQCALYVSARNKTMLKEYCDLYKPDVIIVDMVRLAPYIDAFEDFPASRIIDFDDLLSKRYMRQVDVSDSGSNVLGKYSESASSIFTSLLNVSWVKRAVLKAEAKRVAAAEVAYATRYDASILISEVETRELSKAVGLPSVFTATMGTCAYPYVPEDERDIKYDCCFIGNMETAANQDSLNEIAKDLLPLIPGITLRVIGRCPEAIKVEYCNHLQISFSDWVDDMGAAVRECKVMLAPLTYGTGIKTKILEAMAFGMPVVTNSIGMEGIDYKDRDICFCGDNVEDLVSMIMELLRDSELRRRLAINAARFVETEHRWEKSVEQIEMCIDYCAKKRIGEIGEGR